LPGEGGDELDLALRAERRDERAGLLCDQRHNLLTQRTPAKRRIDYVPVARVLVPFHADNGAPMKGLDLPDVWRVHLHTS
jgi:hypothetical protein